ncbi:MAG TPA: pteridine reductase [Gammaproteobacteria bacterium]|nr:pteridine reductase [Gammaproteobacteria bacterium]
MTEKSVLITGGAARIGARIARKLHQANMDIIIHYRRSDKRAKALAVELNAERADSATTVHGDLLESGVIDRVVRKAAAFNNRLDALINNASTFYPTEIGEVTEKHWDDLIGTNMKVPFFLSQAAVPWLKKSRGCIVNLVDIHALRPKRGYLVYSIAKAANAMLVKSLALELGPEIRVNGVAPGVILWPEHDISDAEKQEVLSRIALQRPGDPDDIAETVVFLVTGAEYITGQIIAVDGGRTVQQ